MILFYYMDNENQRAVGPMSVTVLLKLKDSGIINEDVLVKSDNEPKWVRLGSLTFSRGVSSTDVTETDSSPVQPSSVNGAQKSNPDEIKNSVPLVQQSTSSPVNDFLTPSKWKPFLIFGGFFLVVTIFLKMIGYHDRGSAELSTSNSRSPSQLVPPGTVFSCSSGMDFILDPSTHTFRIPFDVVQRMGLQSGESWGTYRREGGSIVLIDSRGNPVFGGTFSGVTVNAVSPFQGTCNTN